MLLAASTGCLLTRPLLFFFEAIYARWHYLFLFLATVVVRRNSSRRAAPFAALFLIRFYVFGKVLAGSRTVRARWAIERANTLEVSVWDQRSLAGQAPLNLVLVFRKFNKVVRDTTNTRYNDNCLPVQRDPIKEED